MAYSTFKRFVAVGRSSEYSIMYSDSGQTWTAVTGSQSENGLGIQWFGMGNSLLQGGPVTMKQYPRTVKVGLIWAKLM